MWIFVLVLNILTLFVFYKIFSNRIIKNSALDELISKYRAEIDSIVKTFNKASYDNITLLEEKIEEATNLLKYLNKQKEELIKIQSKVNSKHSVPIKPEKTSTKKVKSLSKKDMKQTAKSELVLMYFNEGYSIKNIANELDITENEVKLYVRNSQ